LVHSSTHQIDIVHHEDTEGSLEAGGESDTIHPEDNVTSERFRENSESVLEATEETEKSELTVSSETVEDMLKRKKRRSLSRGLLTVFGILVLVGGFAWFKSSATWDRWFNSDSSLDQQGHVPGDEKKFIELKIVTRPSEALVTLNGEDLEDKTPVTLEELEVGTTVALKISKEGFEPIEQTVTLEKDMSDELTFDLKELPPVVYLLSLESTPSGAQVFIDGQPTDHVTPTTLDPIEPGKTLRIGLKLDKYKTFEQDFVAQGDLEQKLTAPLEPIPFAKAVITSTPSGAAIFVNDLSLNHTTPYTLENLELPQRLFVRLEKDGYEKFEKTIEVTEARDFLVEGRLDKKPPPVVEVPVRITANIAGAQIFINGEERGVTPLKLSLVPGDYQVVVSKLQYKSQSKTLTVKAGAKLRDTYFQLNLLADVTPPADTTSIGHPGDIENTNSQLQTTGRLRVDSSPRGASVKVNGAPAGVTPIVVGDLPKHRPVSVQVSKPGYGSWQSTVTLVKDYTEMNAVLTQ